MPKSLSFEDRMKQIKPLVDQGMTCAEIGLKIGLLNSQTKRLVRRGRKEGHLPDKKIAMGMRNRRPVGLLSASLKGQDQGFIHWLEREVPEGMTVSDFAVACMIDQYHEELKGKNQ